MICPKYNWKYLGLTYSFATHSETNCSSLLSVAVISVAVVADVYSVESSAYIDTLAFLKVKIEKSKGPKQLPWGIPDSNWIIFERLPLKNPLNPLCSVGQVTVYLHYSRGCNATTYTFSNSRL